MAKHRRLSDDGSPSTGPARPNGVADLLAPPIVVGVARVVATSRMTPPVDGVGPAPARTPGPIRWSSSAGVHRGG